MGKSYGLPRACRAFCAEIAFLSGLGWVAMGKSHYAAAEKRPGLFGTGPGAWCRRACGRLFCAVRARVRMTSNARAALTAARMANRLAHASPISLGQSLGRRGRADTRWCCTPLTFSSRHFLRGALLIGRKDALRSLLADLDPARGLDLLAGFRPHQLRDHAAQREVYPLYCCHVAARLV